MQTSYDAIVIGAGPVRARRWPPGLRAPARRRCWSSGPISAAPAVNNGCIPTKSLVASARVAHMARRAADFGVSAGPVSVDMFKVKARKRCDRQRFGASGLSLTGWLENMANPHTLLWGSARFVLAPGTRSRSAASATRRPKSISIPEPARWCRTGRAFAEVLPPDQRIDDGYRRAAAPSDRRRRQLYRPRICADVPPLRQPRHRDRARRSGWWHARTATFRTPSPISCATRASCCSSAPTWPSSALPSSPTAFDRRPRDDRRQGSRNRRRHASAGRHRPQARTHRRPPDPRQGRGQARRARPCRGGRPVAHQCRGHLGDDGRPDRAWRLHPHLVERLRDHRRQSLRQRPAPRQRPWAPWRTISTSTRRSAVSA